MNKDFKYLELANVISQWSKDPSTKVGAVIVGSKGQIVSQGYNGFPRGFDDSDERFYNREIKYKYIIHAEANALYNALYNGASVEGCTIYVHGLPVCSECAKAIVQSGIKKVVFDTLPKENWIESNKFALEILREGHVEYEYLEKS